jgi:hypothetical protein
MGAEPAVRRQPCHRRIAAGFAVAWDVRPVPRILGDTLFSPAQDAIAGEHPTGDLRVAACDAVHEAAQVEGDSGHIDATLLATQHLQHLRRDEIAEQPADQIPVEAIVPRWDRRVGREDGAGPNVVEAPLVARPPLVPGAHDLERGEAGVPLVQVIPGDLPVSGGGEQADAAHTEDDLLRQLVANVAAVEALGESPIDEQRARHRKWLAKSRRRRTL